MARRMSKTNYAKLVADQQAYFEERSKWFAVDQDGKRLEEGDKVTTFRGEELEFGGIEDYPTYGKSGKVWVTDPTIEKGKPFHRQGFYPSVINVELRREAKKN
jgi:hypothetical protein